MADEEYDAFIAFSPTDGAEAAVSTEKGLANRGVKVFVEHQPAGGKLRSHEEEAANSDAFVLILTKGYLDNLLLNKSPQYKDLAAAILANVNIVPVMDEKKTRFPSNELLEQLPIEMRAVFLDLSHRAVKDGRRDEEFFSELLERCRPEVTSPLSASSPPLPRTPGGSGPLSASQLADLLAAQVADLGVFENGQKPSLSATLTLHAPKTPPPKQKAKIIGVEAKPRVVKGHSEPVLCVRFSPDSVTLASGSADKTVRIWDPASGNLKQVFAGHNGRVLRLCFIGSGTILFSASKDKYIYLWDMIRMTQRAVMEGHSNVVWGLDVCQDGTRLMSSSHDESIRTWDIMKGVQVSLTKGHTSTIYSVAISPDQKYFATCSADKTVKIWDYVTRKELKTLVGHTSHVTQVAWVPDSNRICSSSWDETVKLWDVEEGTVQHTFTGHSSKVNCVAVSPDGGTIISGSDDMSIKLFRIATGECFSTLEAHTAEVMDVTISPDGQMIASASADNTIRLWKVLSV